MKKFVIQYMFTRPCPSWKKGLEELNKAIKELKIQKNVTIKMIEIKSKESAEKHKFLGSPAIRIGDTELTSKVEESPKPVFDVCRIYLYNDKLFEYPPKDMIKEFIVDLSVFKETVKEC